MCRCAHYSPFAYLHICTLSLPQPWEGTSFKKLNHIPLDKVKVLAQYLPPDAAPLIGRWIDHFKCEFKISRNRGTKFGDYRAPFDGKGHRISVNYDLNAYAFPGNYRARVCAPAYLERASAQGSARTVRSGKCNFQKDDAAFLRERRFFRPMCSRPLPNT
jgi:hypothetical protein